MCAQRRLKSVYVFSQSDLSLPSPHQEALHPLLSKLCPVKILIRADLNHHWANMSEGMSSDAAVNIIIFGLLNGLFLFLTLGSGTIEFPEFLMMMVRKVKAPDTPDELINAFSVFDYEKNGFISVQQLCHVMTNLGEKLSMAEMTEMIKQSGVDIHGQINYAGVCVCVFCVCGVGWVGVVSYCS